MPFQPTDELTMRLTVAEWNEVIAQLNEGKHRIVAPLIGKIQMQAAQHEAQSRAGFTNGQDDSLPAGTVTAATIVRGDLN